MDVKTTLDKMERKRKTRDCVERESCLLILSITRRKTPQKNGNCKRKKIISIRALLNRWKNRKGSWGEKTCIFFLKTIKKKKKRFIGHRVKSSSYYIWSSFRKTVWCALRRAKNVTLTKRCNKNRFYIQPQNPWKPGDIGNNNEIDRRALLVFSYWCVPPATCRFVNMVRTMTNCT